MDRERSFQLMSAVSLKWQEASTRSISIKHWLQCSQGIILGLIYSCVLLLLRKASACSWALRQLGMFCSTKKSGYRQVWLFSSYLPRTCYPEFTVIVGVGGWDIGLSEKWQELPRCKAFMLKSSWRYFKISLKGDMQWQHLKKKVKSNFAPHFSGRGMKKKMRFYLGLLHNMINIFLLTFLWLSTMRTWVAYSF